jgi:hypothetical protein
VKCSPRPALGKTLRPIQKITKKKKDPEAGFKTECKPSNVRPWVLPVVPQIIKIGMAYFHSFRESRPKKIYLS